MRFSPYKENKVNQLTQLITNKVINNLREFLHRLTFVVKKRCRNRSYVCTGITKACCEWCRCISSETPMVYERVLSVRAILRLLLLKNQQYHNMLPKTRSTRITNAIHNTTNTVSKL